MFSGARELPPGWADPRRMSAHRREGAAGPRSPVAFSRFRGDSAERGLVVMYAYALIAQLSDMDSHRLVRACRKADGQDNTTSGISI